MAWDSDQLVEFVEGVLRQAAQEAPVHHFDNPWMTIHQLAIEVSDQEGATVKHVGGRGSGVGSLAEHLGRILSVRILHNPECPIEGGWLSPRRIESMRFDGNIDPTRLDSVQGMSMYRLRRGA